MDEYEFEFTYDGSAKMKKKKPLDKAMQKLENKPSCFKHVWKEDFHNPFSGAKYESCTCCGMKKEDYKEPMTAEQPTKRTGWAKF